MKNTNAQQGVCCYAGRRIYLRLFIAISPYPADGILSAFVAIFIISFSIGCGSGLDIIKYQHSSKLCPLAEIVIYSKYIFMRGINYMAAFGTILILISVYSFKAAFYKKVFKEKTERAEPVKSSTKVLLILFSVICLALGILLILKALKII